MLMLASDLNHSALFGLLFDHWFTLHSEDLRVLSELDSNWSTFDLDAQRTVSSSAADRRLSAADQLALERRSSAPDCEEVTRKFLQEV